MDEVEGELRVDIIGPPLSVVLLMSSRESKSERKGWSRAGHTAPEKSRVKVIHTECGSVGG